MSHDRPCHFGQACSRCRGVQEADRAHAGSRRMRPRDGRVHPRPRDPVRSDDDVQPCSGNRHRHRVAQRGEEGGEPGRPDAGQGRGEDGHGRRQRRPARADHGSGRTAGRPGVAAPRRCGRTAATPSAAGAPGRPSRGCARAAGTTVCRSRGGGAGPGATRAPSAARSCRPARPSRPPPARAPTGSAPRGARATARADPGPGPKEKGPPGRSGGPEAALERRPGRRRSVRRPGNVGRSRPAG
jgi:hypothetical protein